MAASCSALEWEIVMPFEKTIFPSVVIGMRSFLDEKDNKPSEIGDPIGMIGVEITAPRNDFAVKVTVEGTDYFKTSTIKAVLPKKGKSYTVSPYLRYEVSKLIRHKQRGFDTAHVIVTTEDGEYDDSMRFEVRSVNDCVLGITHDGEFLNTRFLFSSYVNENNPLLDKILGHALKSKYVDAFIGYQGTRADVIKQAKAIYNSLQDMGFKYSSITQASGTTKNIATQHVRFVGEALATSQANCIDGTVIFASIFMKLGLNPVIITVPGHAYVGVYKSSSSDLEFLVPIETTVMGNSTFEYANKIAQKNLDEHLKDFADSDKEGYQIIDVRELRKGGIDPILEVTD